MREADVAAWLRWIAPKRFSFIQQVAAGALLALTAVLFRIVIHPLVSDTAPYFLLIPTLFVATTIFGAIAGSTCLLIGLGLTSAFIFRAGTVGITGGGPSTTTLVFVFTGITIIILGVGMRGLVIAARASEKRADLLAGEMGHRAKNILTLAQVIVRLSAKSADGVEQLVTTVEQRLGALSRAQSVAETHAGSPPLSELVAEAVAPFGPARFSISGEPVVIERDKAKNLGLLLHELCTNSMKYGALSVPAGRISIHWTRTQSGTALIWTETGGPPVAEPATSGFGSRLANALFAADGGGASFQFAPTGLRCQLVLPDNVSPPASM